jgi:hypothetical protein
MHRLLKPLRYVFYRILEWKLRDRREATPVLVAALATVLLLFLNVITATMLVNGFRGRLLLPNFPGGRIGLSGVLLIAFYLGYNMMRLAWVENGRYDQLEREFQSTDTRIGTFRTALFWSYLVLSVLVPFLLSIFWPRN